MLTFLRADRLEDETLTFNAFLVDTIPNSFGYDKFLRIFGETDEFKGIN